MNLFQKYGIKEVADVVFYTITEVGDEEFYTPVLFLDTLKVSTLEKAAEKVEAKGGKGNKKLITWNFGKEVTLNLEDALFSPASMSLIWGGRLEAKLSVYTSAIVKCNMANKYGNLNYSTKAYPSPALTDEEWDVVFECFNDLGLKSDGSEGTAGEDDVSYLEDSSGDLPAYVAQNRVEVIYNYFRRKRTTATTDTTTADEEKAMPQAVINAIIEKIQNLDDIGYIDTENYDLEIIDRMEKCIVKDRYGMKISTAKQKENLLKYYKDDKTCSYTIYYDAKTMLPLVQLAEDGTILGWDGDEAKGTDSNKNGENPESDEFTIKLGTIYYKWTRTVKYKEGIDDGILGKTLVIDAETFPDAYKIVGECYIREQKTGKDQRYQFVIHRATVTSDTSITLEAEGDPTTFSMSVDVLVPPNDIMMELKQFDVEEDKIEGGTRIIPQKSRYTYTPTNIDMIHDSGVSNDEIY